MNDDLIDRMTDVEYGKYLVEHSETERLREKIEQIEEYSKYLVEHSEAETERLREKIEQIEEQCRLSTPYPECEIEDLSEWEEDSRLDDVLKPMGEPSKILPLLGYVRSLYPDRDKKGILNPQRFPEEYKADLIEQMQNFDAARMRQGFTNDIQALFKKQDTKTETATGTITEAKEQDNG